MSRPPAAVSALVLVATLVGPQLAAPSSAAGLEAQLQRIFKEEAFKARTFGPTRWLDGGSGYTTLEDAADGRGKDIVRYDTASGDRRVVVAAASLVPAEAGPPLSIDDYAWSDDGTRLLVFTNTRKVWRKNTRGDYWVLERSSGALRQVGSGFPEATLMFAKLSPDGTRVAFVQERDLYVESLEDGAVTRLDVRRLVHQHQRHLGLGLRGGVQAARRLSLESRRHPELPSGTSTPRVSASSPSSTTPTRRTPSSPGFRIPRSGPRTLRSRSVS